MTDEVEYGPTDEQFGEAVERKINKTEPEPEAVERGDIILNAVEQFLNRFCIHPSEHALVAHVLWIAHTHLMDVWDSTPRLCFLSPEPASGKTRCLEITELLVPSPVVAVNVSPAYLFRKVGQQDGCTILFDEIDTVFGPKAKENEEIRGLLNAGHRRGAVAGRCVTSGKEVRTEEIPAYCAVALAGLHWLPDTIMSRAVIIRMRRRLPDEVVEPFRRRIHAAAGHRLRTQLAGWAAQVGPSINWPDMPVGVEDRDADVWEALIAVADTAGGDWPRLAREAAKALVKESKDREPSLGIRLLADTRTAFGDAEQMTTEALLRALHAMPEAPWNDLKGKQLDQRGLAHRLRQYSIKSKQIRTGSVTLKGYTRQSFHDAWKGYLPPLPPGRSETSETSETSEEKSSDSNGRDVSDASGAKRNSPETSETKAVGVSDVSDNVSANVIKFASKISDVSDVSDVSHFSGGEGGARPALCAYCGKPGGLPVGVDGVVSMVHPDCRSGWLASGFNQKSWTVGGSSQ
jgi:hypothetical protein